MSTDQTQNTQKGIFKAAGDSIKGLFALVDNTVYLGNRTIDQGHMILNVSEANLKKWEQEALSDLDSI